MCAVFCTSSTTVASSDRALLIRPFFSAQQSKVLPHFVGRIVNIASLLRYLNFSHSAGTVVISLGQDFYSFQCKTSGVPFAVCILIIRLYRIGYVVKWKLREQGRRDSGKGKLAGE